MRIRPIAIRVLAIVLVLTVLEGMGWLLSRSNPQIEKIRFSLLGKTPLERYQYCSGQAYLNYIPAPSLSHSGFAQHNAMGWRGESVPLARIPHVPRVLFLGGSVVYGWGVADPSQTYPAVCGQLLEDTLGSRRVEIINAGAPWLTTAEMLNYYVLKFRYYRPDVVVINEGGNDAETVEALPGYQPDYSHCRKPLALTTPLPAQSRWLMHSRLLSWLVIQLFFSNLLHDEMFVHENTATPAAWYPKVTLETLPPEDFAYANNLGTLVREAAHDGARVILMEWAAQETHPEVAHVVDDYAYASQAMQTVAQQNNVPFVPFPRNKIAPRHWVDDCHLNAEGERIKAQHLLPYLLSELRLVDSLWVPPGR